jgi:hypothetical protein
VAFIPNLATLERGYQVRVVATNALVPSLLLLPLLACGGGGGSDPEPAAVVQRVELTVGLEGSGTIGAVDFEIELPEGFVGFSLEIDGQVSLANEGLIELGTGGIMGVNHIAENRLLLISIVQATGFNARSDLFKISKVYAAGSVLPTEDNFMVTLIHVSDGGPPLEEIDVLSSFSITAAP